MQERTIDRIGWATGPWDQEPDRIQFQTEAGLVGLIVRNPLGSLCGYVAVENDHPFYGRGYGNIEDQVDVHGGLTYADACREDSPICHVPEPGQSDQVWWFGFDCAHGGDVSPGMEAREREMGFGPLMSDYATYKDLAYVRAEVESLARQLVDLS